MESGFGLKIREKRKTLGLTQAEVARSVGISTSYFNLIERGKRSIGGALLLRIARALDLDPAALDDDAERRLVTELTETAADPLLSGLDLDAAAVPALVGRHPAWARALALLHRECRDRGEVISAMSDRLSQDPFLSDVVHRMLTTIAGIRSTAEILDSVDDLEATQSRRFRANLAAESTRLSEAAQALADFFDRSEAPKQAITPGEEVDDFIIAHGNHFPALEEGTARLRARLGANAAGGPVALAAVLASRKDVAEGNHRPLSAPRRARAGYRNGGHGEDPLWDGDETASEAGRRFAMARHAVLHDLKDTIDDLVAKAPQLISEEARQRVVSVLASYGAAALLFPYDPFLEDAERLRYDIGLMRRRYQASFEQICQRLVSLRRPGAEGVPFAMLRVDPAGNLSKRFPLPRLPMPRHGAACPLWAVYRAFQTPGPVVRQLVELPAGDRFLFVARVVRKGVDSFAVPARQLSVAIVCHAQYADRLVYGDGLDLSGRARAEPVGVSCRVCPRVDCQHRAEDPIVPT
ncbi:XRE family transcriptional regulator [uncultured Rhodospira sp.]|uniref:XRE family transcriptional regulator n=1 Tax=uncultured Rhodospira sp. TaxID=1936189 RepID=UPI002604BB6B|nr:XRE family transcriptional regulator [uncultured Rhodospira sp.]